MDTDDAHDISEGAASLDSKVQDGKIPRKPRRVKRYELSNLSPEGNMSKNELRRKHTISLPPRPLRRPPRRPPRTQVFEADGAGLPRSG